MPHTVEMLKLTRKKLYKSQQKLSVKSALLTTDVAPMVSPPTCRQAYLTAVRMCPFTRCQISHQMSTHHNITAFIL